ncbi:hypothetical protein BDQ17DRAFT_1175934, partial [Cyathus striatus]
VTYILQDEVPEYTKPYIDDCPLRGPATWYELENGGYETIKENSGIRRTLWQHFQNVNRILQQMKYSGGTFLGKKSILCADEFEVVGHMCSYKGHRPTAKTINSVTNWGPCEDFSDVRAFLGTV